MSNIEKLPKCAQEHIATIQRERDTAVRALNEYTDAQTKSPFYFDDWLCIGPERGPTSKRVYVQTHKITVQHAGVSLDVTLYQDHISLQYSAENRRTDEAMLVPSSFQQFRLRAVGGAA